MITVYKNGHDFLRENSDYLMTDRYLSNWFFMDAPLIDNPDHANYMLKAEEDGKQLLVLKMVPYNLIVFGDAYCAEELFAYMIVNDYRFDGILGEKETCDVIVEILKEKFSLAFIESIGMDFLETSKYTEASSDEVTIPYETDVDEICLLETWMFEECGLDDSSDRESIRKSLSDYRIIRKDGKIVSLAHFADGGIEAKRISTVYTRTDYRGCHYARKIVNTMKNEAISQNRKAVLNVDRNNPISYHLYASLGFKRLFSQSVYQRKK